MIDGSTLTNWGFTPANATDPAIEIVFDFGEQKAIGAFKWWNRPTSGNLFADNIDLYIFTNDDPTDTPILLDMDLATDLRQPGHPRDNDDIYSEVIDITDFYGRYVKLVFDDGPQQSNGLNIQGSEIAFRAPEPMTIVLLVLGGLALIRKKR